MKRMGTVLKYTINGARFNHQYTQPFAALARAEVLVANGVTVKVKHVPLKVAR